MAQKTLLKFNVKNVKYALEGQAPKLSGKVDSIALEADYTEQKIYGDGEVFVVIPSDKGKTGTLTMVSLDEEYEIAMGRKKEIEGGVADIQSLSTVRHSIYFETDAIEDGQNFVIKTWLFGVTSSSPSEELSQTTDGVNLNNYEYTLTITGVKLQTAEGENYADEFGNTFNIYKLSSRPTDLNYATFGDTVPTPTAKGGTI